VNIKTVRAIVLHHTCTPSGDKNIYENILNNTKIAYQGRFRAPYHYFVGSSGMIFIGQNEWEVAPHCGIDEGDYYQDESGVNNQNSIAISCIGNFEFNQMKEEQYQGLLKLCRELKKKYPKAFFKLHCELVSTACPGKYFPYPRLFKEVLNLSEDKIFKDLDSKRWSAYAIQELYTKGYIKGYPDGTIKPLESMKREEFFYMFYQLLKSLGKI